MSERRERKAKYVTKLEEALDTYRNVLIVGVDNVGSKQMQQVRLALRGKAIVLMGKNTLIRKIIRDRVGANPKLETLLPLVVGNMGFVFTNSNLSEIRKTIMDNKVPAAAKSGSFAPTDVFIPPGATGLDPGQTGFFQALNIATKIVKGSIEIVNEVHLLKAGDKVTSSHVALLDKINIRPFFYGFKVMDVYEDGTVYSADILDMSQEMLLEKFLSGAAKAAAISLAIGYPTSASVGHSLRSGFKNLLAISLSTEIEFAESKKFKDFLANPGAFAAAAPTTAKPAGGAAAKKEEPKKVSSEESDVGGGFSMFD